jgi:hypothetical protein
MDRRYFDGLDVNASERKRATPPLHRGRVTVGAALLAAGSTVGIFGVGTSASAADDLGWSLSQWNAASSTSSPGTTFVPGDSVFVSGRVFFDGPDNANGTQDDVYVNAIDCYRSGNGLANPAAQITEFTLTPAGGPGSSVLTYTDFNGDDPSFFYFSPNAFDGTVVLPASLANGTYQLTISCTDIGPDPVDTADDTVLSSSQPLTVFVAPEPTMTTEAPTSTATPTTTEATTPTTIATVAPADEAFSPAAPLKPAQGLPVTGSRSTPWTVLGALFTMLGAMLVRIGRRAANRSQR